MATRVDLVQLLGQASYALTTELTAGLAELGITPRGHCVLSHAQRGDQTQTQLAELCALDKTTMVVTLDELERAGLARRQPLATDRRAHLVMVTDAGTRTLGQADAIVARIYADVLAALAPTERDGFVEGLRRLVDGRLSKPVQCERPVRRRRAPQFVR
jgi:DNA-binding MarR family transcriptional regulator